MTAPLDGVPDDVVLTPRDVASAFSVHSKTVSRWADAGVLASFKTPGGHRRFVAADVRRLLGQGRDAPALTPPVQTLGCGCRWQNPSTDSFGAEPSLTLCDDHWLRELDNRREWNVP